MDFKKIELTWSMGKQRRKLYLPRVLVTPWNGSTLVSMRTLRHISERISPVQNPEIQQIFTFAALAIAFLLRPIGGIVFGIIGDKYGRKVVLTTTIILMALSTLTIGVLPNYDMIGLWAPALLLLARILQGFSTGGEYAGAMTYIAEISPDKKRNSLGSGLEIELYRVISQLQL